MLCVLVNTRFQVLFHSPPGVLFTFPSQYCSTIGHQVVFRLGGWAPLLLTGFHVSADTLDTANLFSRFTYKTFTFFGGLSHTLRLRLKIVHRGPNPTCISTYGLASSAFARHYSRNLVWFLFLPLLRCFSSGGSPRIPMYSVYVSWFFIMRVSSFGYLRIEAYLQLPAAFRSLSRPSSAPDAKAFTLCSCSLELPYFFCSSCFSLELLEFHKQIILISVFFFSEKVLSFSWNCFIPPFGEIVVITQIGKTLIDLTNLVKSLIVLLSVRFLLLHLYSVFNEHNIKRFRVFTKFYSMASPLLCFAKS